MRTSAAAGPGRRTTGSSGRPRAKGYRFTTLSAGWGPNKLARHPLRHFGLHLRPAAGRHLNPFFEAGGAGRRAQGPARPAAGPPLYLAWGGGAGGGGAKAAPPLAERRRLGGTAGGRARREGEEAA